MAKKKALYSVHPGVAMVQKWIAELKEKTGRDFDEWLEYIRRKGPKDVKDQRAWLKEEHGLGTNTAWWLSERASGAEMGMADDTPEAYLKMAPKYVEDMFAGGKAGLRPLYDKLLDLGLSLGSDVKACPCKTIVPLYRQHVFAELKPSTRTRLDLGLALKDTPCTGKLLDVGSKAKGNRITRRFAITSLADIDDEVKKWLKEAYDRDAPMK